MTGEGRPQDITPRRARASCGIVQCGEPIPLLTSPRGAQAGNWLPWPVRCAACRPGGTSSSLHGALAARFLDLDGRLVEAVEVLSVPLVANPTSGRLLLLPVPRHGCGRSERRCGPGVIQEFPDRVRGFQEAAGPFKPLFCASID